MAVQPCEHTKIWPWYKKDLQPTEYLQKDHVNSKKLKQKKKSSLSLEVSKIKNSIS